jgi:hypothetical protein
MNDRTIWIVRIIAILVFLILAYLMLDLYSRLRRMEGERANLQLQIADCRLQITEPSRAILV